MPGIVAKQRVIAAAPGDAVVAGLAKDQVVTFPAVQGVVTGTFGGHRNRSVEIDIRDVHTGIVGAVLCVFDHDVRYRARNLDKHRIFGRVVVHVAAGAGGRIVPRNGIGVVCRQVRPGGQYHLDGFAVFIKGGNAYNSVAIDIIDTKGDVFHWRVKGKAVTGFFAISVGHAFEGRDVINGRAISVNTADILVCRFEPALDAGRGGIDRECDIHISGVL